MAVLTAVLFLWAFSGNLPCVQCHSPETKREKRSDDLIVSLENVVSSQAQKISALEAELMSQKNAQDQKTSALETELQSQKNAQDQKTSALEDAIARLNASQGSSFVRWGRSVCPAGTTLLYSGYAAGSYISHSGGGANRLCVTKHPVLHNTQLLGGYGVLSGMEYYFPGHQNTDAVCAVCQSPRAVTYMLPGTNRCPTGSVAQYRGYLTSGNFQHAAPSEFVCVDESPEDRPGTQGDQASGYFDNVISHCGALPCPPYEEGKVVTCVVCSV